MLQLRKGTASKLTALLLALMMAVVFMPTFAFAADGDNGTDSDAITVQMTVSDQGLIAKTKDGDAMAWKDVTVTDRNNDQKYTFDEALVAAHEQYNTADGYAKKDSGWVEKLWGNSTAPGYSFFRNDSRTDLVTLEEVNDGDDLVASINRDGEFYADWAAYFDTHEETIRPGETLDLELKGFPAMTTNEPIPGEDIQIGLWEDGEFEPIEDAETDEDGEISLEFDDPGTYIITTDPEDTAEDVVNAGDYPENEGLWKLITMGKAESGKRVYGKMNLADMYDMDQWYYAYTEDDYGDGPYPWDDIEFDAYDNYDDVDDFVENVEGYPVYSGMVLTDCPLIAAACVVNVEPSIDVYVTVSNKGEFAETKDGEPMVDEEVTVKDLNNDGKFTYDEAMIAAHEKFCPSGAEGFSAPGGWISKLWGVDTMNTLFFTNNKSISPSTVAEAVVEDEDELCASINADDKYYADFMSYFNRTYRSIDESDAVTLQLKGFMGMGMGDQLTPAPLKGIQLGYWKDGKFEAIEGAVTDENGEVTFFPEKAGNYLVTAQGTVRAEVVSDWTVNPPATVEADCPIIAPFCFLDVDESPGQDLNKYKANVIKELAAAYNLNQYRVNERIQVLGALLSAQANILTAANAGEIKTAVAEARTALDAIKTDAQYKAEEQARQKEEAAKVAATKVDGVKVKPGKKKITVTWTMNAAFDGYQVSYAKKGKKAKIVTVVGKTTTKKVIKGLKKNKKYTVKVRGYKNIGGAPVYGPWSADKTVKVKAK